jgi:5-methylcytosine-specific restriction enzyme subunit McrC
MNTPKNIVIKEFRYLYSHDKTVSVQDDEGNYAIYREHFQLLEDFILANKIEDQEDAGEFLLLGSKIIKGKREKIIKAKNYVGVIQLRNGFTIEILPKIFEDDDETKADENNKSLNKHEYARTRKLFVKMLRTLKTAPFKHFEMANLKSARMPLYEIFILMFLDELTRLVRKGIKSAYMLQIENESFLKGKLRFNEHLRKNYINKHKFYIEFDEYLPNRPENRLIKSTLLYLQKNSKVQQPQNRIRQFLFVFDEIKESKNYDSDFIKCKDDRLISYYEKTLDWCRIFLKNKSFINYRGNSAAFSLLFPMEKIFESDRRPNLQVFT